MTSIEKTYMLSYDAVLDYETMKEISHEGYSRIPIYQGIVFLFFLVQHNFSFFFMLVPFVFSFFVFFCFLSILFLSRSLSLSPTRYSSSSSVVLPLFGFLFF